MQSGRLTMHRPDPNSSRTRDTRFEAIGLSVCGGWLGSSVASPQFVADHNLGALPEPTFTHEVC